MDLTIQGKTALVTGGNIGIGRAVSLALARCGADVALTYYAHRSHGEQTVAAIEQMGRHAIAFQLDATAYPGNSGSPVYDQQTGRVIGVVNSVLIKSTKEAALENPTGISYAIPVRFVRALLEKAHQ